MSDGRIVKSGQTYYFLFIPVISALLLSVSFAPHNLGFVAWFGLSPFLYALRQRGALFTAGTGLLFGILFVTCTFYWVFSIAVVSIIKFLIFLIPFSLYFLVFGLFYRLISIKRRTWIIFAGPALWVILEYIRSNLFFLSFPLNLLGHSQYNYLPVIQIADLTGAYGISFMIVMVNQLLSQVPDYISAVHSSLHKKDSIRVWIIHSLVTLLSIIFTLSYGWFRLEKSVSTADGKKIRVALVQPNILTSSDMPVKEQIGHLLLYEKFTKEASINKPDLIIWPASSIPAPISSRIVSYVLIRLVNETKAYLLVGGAGGQKYGTIKEGHPPFSNSEFLIAPSGHLEGQYNKIRLLQFNEYLPLNGIIKWPKWITAMNEGYLPGKDFTIFNVSGVRFSTPICWENMFPDLFSRFVRDGAQFMVSVTNEGFFGVSPAPYQTLAINVFRAVENRVSIARSATTGISAIINPDGAIVERVMNKDGKDLFVSGIIVRDIPVSDKKSFYTMYGDVFIYIISGLFGAIIAASLITQKRRNIDQAIS